MKANYFAVLLLSGIILFRSALLNFTNNLTSSLFVKNSSLEIAAIKNQNNYLSREYEALLDFKNNINLNPNYTITNVIKNQYGFNNLIISGDDYKINSEVITNDGLIGLVSKTMTGFSEVNYLYKTNLVVSINDETGKIMSQDSENNLIIKEISNYNNIKINDLVYSVYGTYIGKVIKIKYEIIDHYLTVKPVPINDLHYVAVISR